ncbi:BIG GRAIN 1-like B protein [Nymphaea thermarum]|nr:BIG GRAIN 1-like B protein [Nymphaea thermarum]
MERWRLEKKEERFPRNPSFSSALLDAIYRSTDDADGELCLYRKSTTTTTTTGTAMPRDVECTSKRGLRLDKWTTSHEKKAAAEKLALRRKASELGVLDAARCPPGRRHSARPATDAHSTTTTTSSSSSESSGVSSSETDSAFFSRRQKAAGWNNHPPPLVIPQKKHAYAAAPQDFFPSRKPEGFGGKSRGIRGTKLYDELKKVKQPISPGSRIASFLNSLFATAKKAKLSSSATSRPPVDPLSSFFPDTCYAPTYSSSSTATTTPSSRSCLSKTPSTRGNGVRRSVRFYPMSTIVGEDSRPCGHKCLYSPPGEAEKVVAPLMSERVRARDLIVSEFQRKSATSRVTGLPPIRKSNDDQFTAQLEVEEEEEEDDGSDVETASYSSSDLFELESLTAVGFKELPVYETTSLETNQAIAKGWVERIFGNTKKF